MNLVEGNDNVQSIEIEILCHDMRDFECMSVCRPEGIRDRIASVNTNVVAALLSITELICNYSCSCSAVCNFHWWGPLFPLISYFAMPAHGHSRSRHHDWSSSSLRYSKSISITLSLSLSLSLFISPASPIDIAINIRNLTDGDERIFAFIVLANLLGCHGIAWLSRLFQRSKSKLRKRSVRQGERVGRHHTG